MTTSDLWINDLSGGQSLGQHGGLISPATSVAGVLWDFINAGKAKAKAGHFNVADLESNVSGDLLIEIFTETERRTGRPLIESDGRRSIECVTPEHLYEVVWIEF
jgi:hypothetical protein